MTIMTFSSLATSKWSARTTSSSRRSRGGSRISVTVTLSLLLLLSCSTELASCFSSPGAFTQYRERSFSSSLSTTWSLSARSSSSVDPPPPSPDSGDSDNNNNNTNDGNNLDFPPQEEMISGYSTSVDWDAEWKKVVQNQNQPRERPGKGFYKSEAEIAAIKAANKAQEQARFLSLPSLPSWRSLQGDWKFWIGILLVVSFGSALLTATLPTVSSSSPPPTSISSPDSYFL